MTLDESEGVVLRRYSIVTLPGDGVGPEVVAQAVRVLRAAAARFGFELSIEEIPCGGHYYAAHGVEWPDGSFEQCRRADAILLGAVGHVEHGRTVFTEPGKPYPETQLAGYAQVIGNRQKLDLYANVRPVKLFPGVPQKISGGFRRAWKPEDVDYVIVRENTEDAYAGGTIQVEGGKQTPITITRRATERAARFAFALCRQRDKLGKVTCVDKSNVIGAHAFFREVVAQVHRAEFPELELDFAYVDAFCLLQLQQPERYDVVVAPNLVGDVISDNGSFVQGGMGMAPAGNLGDDHAMFEPVHGSAPALAGRDAANPLAAILSAGMLLDWLGARHADEALEQAARALERAVAGLLAEGALLPQDLGGEATCGRIGTGVLERL